MLKTLLVAANPQKCTDVTRVKLSEYFKDDEDDYNYY